MKKIIICAAILGSMTISANAEVDATTSATEQKTAKATAQVADSVEKKVTVVVDTLQAQSDLEEYYKKEPSYDKTKQKGKAAGHAIKDAAKATKHKVIDGQEDAGAGEAIKEAAKATGETVVEATKSTGRYVKKQAPIVADSIKTKGKRLKEKVKNW